MDLDRPIPRGKYLDERLRHFPKVAADNHEMPRLRRVDRYKRRGRRRRSLRAVAASGYRSAAVANRGSEELEEPIGRAGFESPVLVFQLVASMDLIGIAFLFLVAFTAGFLTRANISNRRRAAARHLRGDT
jgi:hypothetical protein